MALMYIPSIMSHTPLQDIVVVNPKQVAMLHKLILSTSILSTPCFHKMEVSNPLDHIE